MDLKTVGTIKLRMRLGHFTSRKFRTTEGLPQGVPERLLGVHITGGHSASSIEYTMVAKREEYGPRRDEWYFLSVPCVDDMMVMATLRKSVGEK